jgi:hypothetical protein
MAEIPAPVSGPGDLLRDAARKLLKRIANRHAICDPCPNADYGLHKRFQKLADTDKPPYIHWKACKHGEVYRECTKASLPDSLALLLAISGDEKVQLVFVLASTLEWLDEYSNVIPEDIAPYADKLRKKAVVLSVSASESGQLMMKGRVALLENCGFLFSGDGRDDNLRGLSIGCNLGGLSIEKFGSMLKPFYALYPRVFFFDNGLCKDGGRMETNYHAVCKVLIKLGCGLQNFKMTFVGTCWNPTEQDAINRRFTVAVRESDPTNTAVVGTNIHGEGWHDRFLLFAPEPQEQHQPFVCLVFTAPLKAQPMPNRDRLFAGACILRWSGDDSQSKRERLSAFLGKVDCPPPVAPLQEV